MPTMIIYRDKNDLWHLRDCPKFEFSGFKDLKRLDGWVKQPKREEMCPMCFNCLFEKKKETV